MSVAGRRWLEVRARSSAAGDQADLVADALVEAGARGVEERGGWYVAYFEEPPEPDAFLAELRTALAGDPALGEVRLEHGWQDHQEWAETWKRGLAERRLTERLVVHPSWIEPSGVRSGDIVIVLDPGMAFGTAEHGTTRGCIRLLDGVVQSGARILDVGAGSGILSIVAARLGATHVEAIEGDALACEAMAENVRRNRVGELITVTEGLATSWSIAERGPVTGIVANIETGLLRPLCEGFAAALPPGGWLIVSGILHHEWEAVRDELEARSFVFREVDADGEWRSGLFERGR